VSATLLLILTEPSPPAAIPNGLSKGEIWAIFQRRSVKQYKKQNQYVVYLLTPFVSQHLATRTNYLVASTF